MTLAEIARKRRLTAVMKKQAKETLRNLRHERTKAANVKSAPQFLSVRSRPLGMAESS